MKNVKDKIFLDIAVNSHYHTNTMEDINKLEKLLIENKKRLLRFNKLTDAEKKILFLEKKGLNNNQIAEALGLSVRTFYRIKRKMKDENI